MGSLDAATPPVPSAALIEQQLQRILASRHLAASDRLKRFLCLIVEETLAGRGGTLKEYTIGVQVYDRGEAFDPKGDSIVRSEANRLRGRLSDYYADPATHDEVRIDLPRGSYVPTFTRSPGRTGSSSVHRRRCWAAAFGVVLLSAMLGGVLAGLHLPTIQSRRGSVVRAELGVAPACELNGGGSDNVAVLWTRGGSHTALAWTPDGRRLVFVGRRDGVRQLYVRDLDRGEARALQGTEDAQEPAVSPDGRSMVFWTSSGELKLLPLDGGPAQAIVQDVYAPPAGVAVGATGRVVFGFYEIRQRSTRSTSVAVTSRVEGEASHLLPQLVASDTVALFTVKPTPVTWGDERIVAQVLATGERKVLLRDAADARYLPPGYLVFLRRGQLMAVSFDLARLEVIGEPVGVLDGVSQALTGDAIGDVTGAGQFSVSSTGALAYVASPIVPYPTAVLATIDRQGRVADLPIEPRSYAPHLRISPDGRRLAVHVTSLTEIALFVVDLDRGSLTKLSTGGEARFSVWSPDAQRVAFEWNHEGVSQLVWQRADAGAPPEPLTAGDLRPEKDLRLCSWSPQGQQLAGTKNGDIWIVTPGGRQPTPARFEETPDEELSPEFSPDGRWLAYVSSKTGRWEVYVRAYPGPGSPTLVSVNGGWNPAWNPSGSGELFFLEPQADSSVQHRMMAVTIANGRPGTPRLLFDRRDASLVGLIPCGRTRCYDVAPDGRRFFVTRLLPRDPPPPVTRINLVLNWIEELQARVPSPAAGRNP